jgi:integrase
MPTLSVKGVHKRTAKGRGYYYHRATGTRIRSTPDDVLAFATEVARLDAGVLPAPPKPQGGTLGALIAAYRKSPEYTRLKPDTHVSYERGFNALQRFDGQKLDLFDAAAVLGIRDHLFKRSGRWLANMGLSVLSVILKWGLPRNFVTFNAAARVPRIRRPKDLGVANPSWTWAEVKAALDGSSGGLRKAIALAYFTGMRLKDVVEARAESRGNGIIERLSSKPGVPITVYEAKKLSAILDEPDTTPGDTIVVTRFGEAYTRAGFKSVFHVLKEKLEAAGKLRPGRTFHGLRKSMGRDAAELGFSAIDIAGALGQTHASSAQPYVIEAEQKRAAKRVLKALERSGKR